MCQKNQVILNIGWNERLGDSKPKNKVQNTFYIESVLAASTPSERHMFFQFPFCVQGECTWPIKLQLSRN